MLESGLIYTRRRWETQAIVNVPAFPQKDFVSVGIISFGKLDFLKIPLNASATYKGFNFSVGPSLNFIMYGRGKYESFPPEESSEFKFDFNPKANLLTLSFDISLGYHFNFSNFHSVGIEVLSNYMLTEPFQQIQYGATNIRLRSYGIGIFITRHL